MTYMARTGEHATIRDIGEDVGNRISEKQRIHQMGLLHSDEPTGCAEGFEEWLKEKKRRTQEDEDRKNYPCGQKEEEGGAAG